MRVPQSAVPLGEGHPLTLSVLLIRSAAMASASTPEPLAVLSTQSRISGSMGARKLDMCSFGTGTQSYGQARNTRRRG